MQQATANLHLKIFCRSNGTRGRLVRPLVSNTVGNLWRLTYPDNTSVTYEYDENNNLTKVTDWANRTTTYTYDENNNVIGITKPNGSTVTTVYDEAQ